MNGQSRKEDACKTSFQTHAHTHTHTHQHALANRLTDLQRVIYHRHLDARVIDCPDFDVTMTKTTNLREKNHEKNMR